MADVPHERTPEAALTDLEAALDVFCDHADPALMSGVRAAAIAERLGVLGRRSAARQAAMAARAADTNAYAARARSAEDWLARQNGTSRSEAKRAIDTARRLSDCPLAAEAFERGELSIAEADAVSAAAVLDPGAERSLLTAATTTHDLGKVRDAADRVKRAARSAEDEAARVARLRAGRSWREFTTADGHRAVDARFVPEDLAKVMPVIDAFTEAQFTHARTAGRRDRHDAYRADAVLAALAAAGASIGLTPPAASPSAALGPFDPDPTTPTVPADQATAPAGHSTHGRSQDSTVAVATTADTTRTSPATTSSHPAAGSSVAGRPPSDDSGSRGTGPPTTVEVPVEVPDRVRWNVCVIVDAIALKRGYAAPGERCDIPGIGPISVERARELMDDALVDVLVHDTIDIRAYASLTRHKPRPVQLALAVRDLTCEVPGCPRAGHLEADHHHDHAKGGPTDSHNCRRLCRQHHYEKTHLGARYELTDTEILWWPPPPPPGAPPPPEGSIPWRAPRGEHLSHWNLDHPATRADAPPDSPHRPQPAEPDAQPRLRGT